MLPFKLRLRDPKTQQTKKRETKTSSSCRKHQVVATAQSATKSRRSLFKEKHPEVYEARKAEDATRSQIYRLHLHMDAQVDAAAHEKLKRARYFGRIRQQKFRQRRKEQAEMEAANNIINTRRVTQQQVEACSHIRECERKRKKDYRQSLSAEKWAENNSKRRQKYAEGKQRMKNITVEKATKTNMGTDTAEGNIQTGDGSLQNDEQMMQNVTETNVGTDGDMLTLGNKQITENVAEMNRETDASNNIDDGDIGIAGNGTSPNNEQMTETVTINGNLNETFDMSARRKRLSRARINMPQDAELYADTVAQLITKASPRKSTAMEARIFASKKNAVHRIVAESFASTLTSLKTNAKNRKYFSRTLSVLKKYKLQRLAASTLGINRKAFPKKKSKISGRPLLPLFSLRKVTDFYEASSTQLPDKKAVSKKTGLPTKILDRSITCLWSSFKQKFPHIKINRSLFFKSRPSHIKSPNQAKYRGCLCEYCENINLKVKSVNLRLQEEGLLGAKKIDGHWHASALSMCPKQAGSRHNKPDCIHRNCPNCGVEKVTEHLVSLDKSVLISWKTWEQTTEMLCNNGKTYTSTKKSLVTKSGTVGNLLQQLTKELEPHPLHLLNATWQNDQFNKLKACLPKNWVLSVLDFAENYNAFYQDEISSAYWNHNQVTIHPIVTYYNCTRCSSVMTESLIFISDDNKHDYHAVHHFVQLMHEHLHVARHLNPVKSVRFSDGCAAQYKSKGPLADIAHSMQDFGYDTQHNFFGSRHGKGPSDGESAVVKSMASIAVKSTTTTIANALDLYKFLHEHATKDGGCKLHFRRTIFFVPGTDVKRNRLRDIQTIAGTRKLHSVESTSNINTIKCKLLSCFCTPCLNGTGQCENYIYVDRWEEVTMHCIKAKTTGSVDNTNIGDDVDSGVDKDCDGGTKCDGAMGGGGVTVGVIDGDLMSEGDGSTEGNGAGDDIKIVKGGHFVAVRLKPGRKNSATFVYMAEVISIAEEHVTLKYMRKQGNSLYTWPPEDDYSTQPIMDILYILTAPQLINAREQFQFLEAEIRHIKNIIPSKVYFK